MHNILSNTSAKSYRKPRITALHKNILILALSGILAKLFDFAFRAYYSRLLGDEGMGLLSLGFSLHGVMLTIATAGLGIAVSSSSSVYMERCNPTAVKRCVRLAIFGVTAAGLIITLLTFIFAPRIALIFLGDSRITFSLCTLAPSIVFMGISYCTKGCFYAIRKTFPPASSEILEQIVKYVSIRLLLRFFLPYGLEYACAAIFLGITVGEFSSCLYLLILYKREEARGFGIRQNCSPTPSRCEILTKLLCVSVPCMLTSLCNSVLRMREEVLLISALERGGYSHSDAVSALGVMHGMVLPLLVLPLTLTGSVMSLLVPEISRAGVKGKRQLRHTAVKTYKIGLAAGIASGVFFLLFGDDISSMLYHTNSAARLTVILAPLCPVMFSDSLSTSMLSGLGRQTKLLKFTLLDFCVRFTLIYFTVPSGKMNAFAFMTAASNIFTCTLSCSAVYRLIGFKNKGC